MLRGHLVNVERGIRGRSSQVDAQLGKIAQVTKLKLGVQLIPLVAVTAANVARDNLEKVSIVYSILNPQCLSPVSTWCCRP